MITDPELAYKEDIDDKILTVTKASAVHRKHDISGNKMELIVLEYGKKETYANVFQNTV